jgi:hypothetical protein
MTSRYETKPFLLILHCYILECIGELQGQNRKQLASLQPKLQQIFNDDGSWFEIVAKEMQFSPDFPATVRAVWEKNLSSAVRSGVELVPREFAEAFVRGNFPEFCLNDDEGLKQAK